MSEINLSALDDLSLSGSGSSASGGSFLGDLWGGVRGVLTDGIGIAGDLTGLVNDWNTATGSNASSVYASQYQPADEQHLSNLNSATKAAAVESAGWVPGVSNGVVVLGGLALALGALALLGRR